MSSDWRTNPSTNLWQGVSGINNPCPSGYRLPTQAEWEAEHLSWGSQNEAGAFASPLKLPLAGSRNLSNGSLSRVSIDGYYWSSTLNGTTSAFRLVFSSGSATLAGTSPAEGSSVRCIKD